MKRFLSAQLIEWKNEKIRKPLLLEGARQVGKTYLLKKFGNEYFPRVHHFDFLENPNIKKVFEEQLDPVRIIEALSVYQNKFINIDTDLIIFDEIGQCPQALTSLKYFAENKDGAYVAASGSLLGIGLGKSVFPVGKVRRLMLQPMTFCEFH